MAPSDMNALTPYMERRPPAAPQAWSPRWGSRGPLVPCSYAGEFYLVNPLAGVEGAEPLAGSGAAPQRVRGSAQHIQGKMDEYY
jgi:hypothetical protein